MFTEQINSLLITGFEGLFYIMALVYVFFTASFAYHWFSYGTKKTTSMTALIVFLIGSIPLFIIMAALLISF